ncbi:MAG TPA: bifunctional biotin--[acetyl-CoA-carboxylase] synthetase/biotin operon repressor [Pseudomonas sp.]|nr:bifunctional biotin--[acetyl-CoA-carboxylase] synthetase/biotin operon repressor [Pseudomonas sp.]HCA24759.1 bifunctional biotin--[acetyl-CoA-carboxylase] synthetase/biotin operon repressor [Pseudomonas sp.]HIQ52549.1 bifunctional biotin--[acetyl-CoA-carboxylase] ligase/biotin operon repressor BirA [Halopseudomonas pachastrellae]|tara:strand:- start:1587 stop:2558 length:972 start_codon:yes stop_codon:yes gene_type:complete
MLGAILTRLADGRFHSGEALGEALGVSRAAIWKALKRLEEQGYPLQRVRGKGYRVPRGACLLDPEAIRVQLPAALAARWEWHLHQQIDSTNAEAQRSLVPGAPRPLIVLAEQQTAGRGRRGRPWSSPYAQNIYLSIVEPVSGGAHGLEGLSLLVGLCLVQALEDLGYRGSQLKWPNDVLLGGAKLAGILLEISGDLTGEALVVIGVGINVLMDSAEAVDQAWTSLYRTGQSATLDRNQLVAAFLQRLAPAMEVFRAEGFAPFRDAWQQRDAWAGQPVRIVSGNQQQLGRAAGVSARGALLLQQEQGVQEISGGEVSLRLNDAT